MMALGCFSLFLTIKNQSGEAKADGRLTYKSIYRASGKANLSVNIFIIITSS